MTGVEDFKKLYGKDMLIEVVGAAERHSDMTHSEIPENEEQRLYYSLLKMLDFECFRYGDAPKGLTQQKTIEFLKDHKDLIKCEPPSMIGLFVGVYNFMMDNDEAKKNPNGVPR